ncbi:hypothetical protein Misp06_03933 [Microbulbifer sp. NBRC 101763]|uniref:hypothetical protein n=1 Tax=Microbulbifer TaxID=48073 RepID=UPI000369316D|nr:MULTISPECIES: hypothetical protein [Microbulbifer]WHI50582.1 hypothetical protein P3339_19415 [Microbulbifer sp. MLAF003]
MNVAETEQNAISGGAVMVNQLGGDNLQFASQTNGSQTAQVTQNGSGNMGSVFQ